MGRDDPISTLDVTNSARFLFLKQYQNIIMKNNVSDFHANVTLSMFVIILSLLLMPDILSFGPWKNVKKRTQLEHKVSCSVCKISLSFRLSFSLSDILNSAYFTAWYDELRIGILLKYAELRIGSILKVCRFLIRHTLPHGMTI